MTIGKYFDVIWSFWFGGGPFLSVEGSYPAGHMWAPRTKHAIGAMMAMTCELSVSFFIFKNQVIILLQCKNLRSKCFFFFLQRRNVLQGQHIRKMPFCSFSKHKSENMNKTKKKRSKLWSNVWRVHHGSPQSN